MENTNGTSNCSSITEILEKIDKNYDVYKKLPKNKKYDEIIKDLKVIAQSSEKDNAILYLEDRKSRENNNIEMKTKLYELVTVILGFILAFNFVQESFDDLTKYGLCILGSVFFLIVVRLVDHLIISHNSEKLLYYDFVINFLKN